MTDEERTLLEELARELAAVPRSPVKRAMNRLRAIRNAWKGSPKIVQTNGVFAIAMDGLVRAQAQRVMRGINSGPVEAVEAVPSIYADAERQASVLPSPARINAVLAEGRAKREKDRAVMQARKVEQRVAEDHRKQERLKVRAEAAARAKRRAS